MGKQRSKKGETGKVTSSRRGGRRRIVARIRFFYCKRGDTILVEAAPNHWGLIDCHLTKASGAAERIRDLIRKKVRKLDFACLTHPHKDHYKGMHGLLQEHFLDEVENRLRVAQFWDSGLDFEVFWAIAEQLGRDRLDSELYELYHFLERFETEDLIEYWPVGSGRQMLLDFGDFIFVALSPRANRVKRFNRRSAEEILQITLDDVLGQAEEANDLSTILVFMHNRLPVNIVLGGDASAEVWGQALADWDRILPRRDKSFAAVKVSHHGALGSLHEPLYGTYCTQRTTIAILSVGPNDRAHPHPNVLNTLSQWGIRAYATCWATHPRAKLRDTLPLPGTSVRVGRPSHPEVVGHDWADIEVRVWSDGKVTAVPKRALLALAPC